MQHIDEGLLILQALNSDDETNDAFCIHPLVQQNADLQAWTYHEDLMFFKPTSLIFAMEYRHWANAWLSDKVLKPGMAIGTPTPGPVPQVREMLIADKVQNYKDFLLYHKETHPKRAELHTYFACWFTALKINYSDFEKLLKEHQDDTCTSTASPKRSANWPFPSTLHPDNSKLSKPLPSSSE
jgi:hypothetical protein